MKRKPTHLIFCLVLLVLCLPGTASAATDQRLALVIGNGSYEAGPLRNPVNDATDMAAALQKLGFKVVLKKNANLQTMEEAIEDFGNQLKRGGVGLFFYAGHGVQVNGVNYLIPIKAKINKESDVRFQAVDAGKVLAEMENANNGLNIVILDACRDNPLARSFRSAHRGLAIIGNAPSGTFISYSTGAGQVARDGEGRNSPYTAALIQYMREPGLTIEDVFKGVRQKLRKETGQVPWELSSLEGKFYFRSGSTTDGAPVTGTAAVDYDTEQRKIEAERELLRQKTDLEEERRKIEEEKQQLTVLKRSPVSASRETGRDGRFIAYDKGTVLDTSTNLMWAAKDIGSDINWVNAKSYCENYRGGGYTDWRMPTKDELVGLYNSKTEQIKLTDIWVWGRETHGSKGLLLQFNSGGRLTGMKAGANEGRTLPVRSVKTATAEQVQREEEKSQASSAGFGMAIQDITQEMVRNSGLPRQSGVVVADVKGGSAAEKAGIRSQDIILQVNKTRVSSVEEYLREIGKTTEKNDVLLLIKRGRASFFVVMKK